MAVVFGRQSFVVTGAEGTWGTESGSYNTNANRIISASIQTTQQRDNKQHLSTGSGGFALGMFDTFSETQGSLEAPLYYEGSGMFLTAIAGAVSTTGGGPTYTHVYQPSTSDLAAASFSMKLQRGSATDGEETFLGMTCSSASISVAAGEEMTLSMEMIGYDSQARASSITPTYNATQKQVYHYESGLISFNGQNYSIRSMEFSCDNALERRNVLGSKLTASPDSTGLRTASINVEMDIEVATENLLYNAAIAGTESAVEITFTETGGSGNSMVFRLNNAIISEISEPLNTIGRLSRTVNFEALATASANAWKITIVNGQSSGRVA